MWMTIHWQLYQGNQDFLCLLPLTSGTKHSSSQSDTPWTWRRAPQQLRPRECLGRSDSQLYDRKMLKVQNTCAQVNNWCLCSLSPSLRALSNPLLENFSSPPSTLLKCLQSFIASFPNSWCSAEECFYLRSPFCPKPGTGAGQRAEKYLRAILMLCSHIQTFVALDNLQRRGQAAVIPLCLPAPIYFL